jgi:tetratricopeptide (TPR) repeat protein
LQGWCEGQTATTGEDASSDKRNLALILANENNDRQQLLAGLLARKLTDDAQRVRDLWLRTSPELSSALAKDIGNAYAPEDPLLAANYWQQLVINLVSTGSGLLEDAGYLTLTHQIHRTRAKAYLQQEKREEFLRELALCRQILPHEWAVVEEFVPKMDALGWQEEADQLFDAQHAKLTALCKAYPQSARFSNGLAWTSAVCGRQLDEALEQARHTLTLKPDEPGYIDTLAEVHFQRKEYAEAVKQQRRAVELAPDATQLRERLTKFEAALAQAGTE